MLRQLERFLQLDERLRSPLRTTRESLAKELNCSERTIQYDLDFLRERLRAPIEFDRHGRGWHYSNPDWRLDMVALTQGELFVLTLGAQVLDTYSNSVYAEELESAIARLADRLPERTWVNLKQLVGDHVRFRVGAELDLDADMWHDLSQACQQQRRVKMTYYTASRNAISKREFDPYLLHFSGNNPYVTGYCHNKNDLRWFRVDRIQELTLLDDQFEIDPEFDADAHLASAFQHQVGGEPMSIAIWFDSATAPYIRERRWHSSQEIDEHEDESLTLRFVARGLDEVKRWVLFYGAGAIVREPPELVELVRQDIAAMTDNYAQADKEPLTNEVKNETSESPKN